MHKRNKKWTFMSGIVAAGLILAACAPATGTPQVIVQTQVVVQTQMVAGTNVVTTQVVNVPVTTTPAPPASPVPVANKDTIVVGTWQEPSGFLGYANNQAIRVEIQEVYRPPFVFSKDFGFQPNPALVVGDLPTIANGGAVQNDVTVKKGDPYFDPATYTVISATKDTTAKQLVVTAKIKPGLVWSDGQPLTVNDWVFAWKTNCSDGSGAIDVTYCPLGSTGGAGGLYVSYVAKDDTTIVATYVPGAVDALYSVEPYGVYGTEPAHLFTGMKAADILTSDKANGGTNAQPLAYGAYMMKEWAKGDHITFVANPKWEGAAPKTPNIIYKFYSDAVALSSAVIAGEVDTSSGITGVDVNNAPYLQSVAKNGTIAFTADKNALSFEMIYLNYNNENDPNFKKGDLASEKPHPVLSDFNVRKAIAMALNRQQMVDTIFYGYSAVLDQPHLPQMASYDPTQGKVTFDLAGAKALLDSAGWVPGADGIRVKAGVRASLTLLTTSGNALRQKSTQIIQANLKDAGIEVKLNYQPSSVVFSTNGLYGRNWDMIEFANVFSNADPGSWWFGNANCGQILTGANGFAGSNFAGWCQTDASNASADAAYVQLDPAKRKADWNTVLKAYFSPPTGTDYRTGGYPVIPLFVRPNFLAVVAGVQGVTLNSTEYFTWNVDTWTATAK